jgi:hypothetical protein
MACSASPDRGGEEAGPLEAAALEAIWTVDAEEGSVEGGKRGVKQDLGITGASGTAETDRLTGISRKTRGKRRTKISLLNLANY